MCSPQRVSPFLCCSVVVYSVNYNFYLNQISLNFYRINSETAFSLSQSHTAVDACDSKKEFLLLYGLFLAARCELSQEGVTKSKFKTWNPWKRQFKCTEIVQFLKHLLIKLFCLSILMYENLWGFTKLKKTKILKISAFYLNKQKSFIPNALPSAIPM